MHHSPDILNAFGSISLGEMDSVKLMDRTDTKFTFNANVFDAVLKEVMNDYRILEVEGKRLSQYKTLYYDTPALNLYLKHHNGELNRYKIRHRTYVESNTGFLEVKFKNNKGRTLKTRIKLRETPYSWNEETTKFLQKKLPFEPSVLIPTLWINYRRLTLVNKHSAERLTIDLGLELIKGDKTRQLHNLVIAEVKQEKKKASPFLKVMKKYHIREGSISKYCLGIALTAQNIKRNNFKPKLIHLKRILHDDLFIANS